LIHANERLDTCVDRPDPELGRVAEALLAVVAGTLLVFVAGTPQAVVATADQHHGACTTIPLRTTFLDRMNPSLQAQIIEQRTIALRTI